MYTHASRRRPRSSHRQLSPWDLVTRTEQGLLRYARARGVVSLAVHYALWGHRLLLRLPAYNDASHFLDRADVALDVEATLRSGLRIVRVAGLALSVPADAVPADLDPEREPCPADAPTSAVIIVPETVSWLPVVDDVRFPPLPDPLSQLPATFAG